MAHSWTQCSRLEERCSCQQQTLASSPHVSTDAMTKVEKTQLCPSQRPCKLETLQQYWGITIRRARGFMRVALTARALHHVRRLFFLKIGAIQRQYLE
eukprot:962691-Amphidinium_carterae.2